jgi:hypothetical protein
MDSLRITEGSRGILFCLSAVALGRWEDENSIFVHTRLQRENLGGGLRVWVNLVGCCLEQASPYCVGSTAPAVWCWFCEVTLQKKMAPIPRKTRELQQHNTAEHLEHFWKALRRRIHSIETDGSCGALKGEKGTPTK